MSYGNLIIGTDRSQGKYFSLKGAHLFETYKDSVYLGSLCKDILMYMVNFMDIRDIITMARTCRSMYIFYSSIQMAKYFIISRKMNHYLQYIKNLDIYDYFPFRLLLKILEIKYSIDKKSVNLSLITT